MPDRADLASEMVAAALRRPFPHGPAIRETLDVVGALTPGGWNGIVRDHLGQTDRQPAVVVADVVRCGTTVACAVIAGTDLVSIASKRDPRIRSAYELGRESGLETVLGGELSGDPVPGGVIANSPRAALDSPDLKGKHLHFLSTNLGDALIRIAESTTASAEELPVYLATAYNLEAVASLLARTKADPIVLVGCGVGGQLALDDAIILGDLIHLLPPTDRLDDASVAMSLLASASPAADRATRLRTLPSWRLLDQLGHSVDLEDCLGGLPAPVEAILGASVLAMSAAGDLPVLSPVPIS